MIRNRLNQICQNIPQEHDHMELKDNGHFTSLYKDKLKKEFLDLDIKKYLKIQKMFYQNLLTQIQKKLWKIVVKNIVLGYIQSGKTTSMEPSHVLQEIMVLN